LQTSDGLFEESSPGILHLLQNEFI
jgi:hypothetical protein